MPGKRAARGGEGLDVSEGVLGGLQGGAEGRPGPPKASGHQRTRRERLAITPVQLSLKIILVWLGFQIDLNLRVLSWGLYPGGVFPGVNFIRAGADIVIGDYREQEGCCVICWGRGNTTTTKLVIQIIRNLYYPKYFRSRAS